MASKFLNMYKLLATTFRNGFRDGVWKIIPTVPKDNATTEWQRKPDSAPRVPQGARNVIGHTEYVPNRQQRRDDRRRNRKQEHLVAIMASKTEYTQATLSMAKLPVRLDRLGIGPRWKKDTLLGAEVFMKVDAPEMTVYKKIYEAAILKYLPTHLTPETTSIITTHLRNFKPKEFLYICRSTMRSNDEKTWYKIGRSTDVAKRMKTHKSCNLALFKVIQVHNSAMVEKLIHTELKDNAKDVCHGLKLCPFCGIGHREMFSVPAGQEGVELLREVVDRWVSWDEWVHRFAAVKRNDLTKLREK